MFKTLKFATDYIVGTADVRDARLLVREAEVYADLITRYNDVTAQVSEQDITTFRNAVKAWKSKTTVAQQQ